MEQSVLSTAELLRQGASSALMQKIMVDPLDDSLHVEFIRRGDHQLIMAYIKNGYYLTHEAQEELLARGDHEEITAFVKKFPIGAGLQAKLIERGVHEEIMAMIAYFPLNEVALTKLYKRYDVEEIRRYTERHPVTAACAEEEFIREADFKTLKRCVGQLPLGVRAQIALVKRGYPELVEAYQSKCSMCEEATELLEKSIA